MRAVIAVALVAAVACTDDEGTPEPGGVSGSEAPNAAATTFATALDAEARIALERELGHHTMLAIDALRAAADDTPRLADAQRALRRNTDQLSEAMSDVLDISAAAFNDVWVARIDALLALVRAAHGEDAEDAEDDLAAAQQEYGALVAEAAPGELSAEDAAAELAGHDAQLVEQLEAHRDGDLAEAFALQRDAFSAAFRIGQQLVLATGASQDATAGAVELRSAMTQLFAEHTWLAVLTARRSARGAKDARHPAAALNGNTEDLTAALLSIYDAQAAVAFEERWGEAIAALLRFTAATVELERDDRRAAAADLQAATQRVAEHLADATEGSIDADEAHDVLAEHFQRLRRHSNAVANSRWRRAYDAADEAYTASQAVADLVAGGIADHRPGEFAE